MTTMPALPSQISAQPTSAETGQAAGRRSTEGAGEAGLFPQMLGRAVEHTQRQAEGQHKDAQEARDTRARGGDAPGQADAKETQAEDEAALQLLAALFPDAAQQAAKQQGIAIDGNAAPGANRARIERPALGERSPAALAAVVQTAVRPAAAPPGANATVDADAALADVARLAATGSETRPVARFTSAPRENAAAASVRQTAFAVPSDKAGDTANTRAIGGQAAPAAVEAAPTGPQALPPSAADTFAASLAASAPAPANSLSAPAAPAAAGQPGAALFVPAPLGHPGWGQAMAQQVGHALQSSAQGVQQAELRLDPPDLGPLRVTLQIQDNVAHAWFVSPHASVRQAVESALPHLAQQLADAGLSLGDTHVGSEQAGYQQPPPSAGQPSASGARGGQQAGSASAAANANPQPPSSDSHLLIDTYA